MSDSKALSTGLVERVGHDQPLGPPATFKWREIGWGLATHNYLCAVCRERMAVLDCDSGILHPCWECQKLGFELVQKASKERARLLVWGLFIGFSLACVVVALAERWMG